MRGQQKKAPWGGRWVFVALGKGGLVLAAQVEAVARQQANEYPKNCPDHSGILSCDDDGGHKATHPQPEAGLTVLKKSHGKTCHAKIGKDVRHTLQAVSVFHAAFFPSVSL